VNASPLEATLHVLDGRWKALLVWQLFWDARAFCELMRRMPGITKKCLRRSCGRCWRARRHARWW
jgi:DNA-binding HxlR family transcriptional regulator